MRFSRRILLGAAARTGVVAWFATVLQGALRGRMVRAAALPATLTAYLDTLIPAEGEAPSASAVGVDSQFAIAASRDSRFAALLESGTRWLDQRARESGGGTFASLAEERRAAIVGMADAADRSTLERQFFDLTRREAFRIYYADARTWPSIGYDGPPQPRGFPAYAQPPRADP